MTKSSTAGVSHDVKRSVSAGPVAAESRFREEQVLAALVLLTTFLLCVFPLMDTDFWWHLRTGQLIWNRGTVPQTDWFLFTDFDKRWIDLHWGFQLLIAAVYGLGGVNLVILVKVLVISTAVGIGWFAVGEKLPAWLRAAVWVPAVICISGRGYERPEMLSQLFLAVWLWVAYRAESQPKWVWVLPGLQIVWINCHALFVLGLIVGGCFALDYGLRKLAGGRFGLEPLAQDLTPKTLLGAGGACAAAALINPYFLEGALFPLVLYRKFTVEQDFYAVRIGEFQSPSGFLLQHGFVNLYLNTQILLSVAAVTSFVCVLLIRRRWSPFRLALLIGFLNLGWEASRNVNIFSLVMATVTLANLSEFFPRNANRGQHFVKPRATDSRINRGVAVFLLVWMAVIVTGRWGNFTNERKVFGLGERPWWFAHEAVQFAGGPGFPQRAFVSHIGIAAVYEYHHGPDKKVFMDPRLEVVTPETFLRWERILAQMSAVDRSWEPLLKDDAGLLPVVILDSRGSRAAINGLMQTRGWRLVHADPAAAVFLSEPQAIALNLPPVDPSPLMFPP